VDLGSGFSSYVLRWYKSNIDPACIVYTVDDDPNWLQKTVDFLTSENLSTDKAMSWTEFLGSERGDFDIILHDIGQVAGRVACFSTIIGLLGENGVVILDDMHKPHFREPIKGILGQHSHLMQMYDISKYTIDEFGRYAWILRRKSL